MVYIKLLIVFSSSSPFHYKGDLNEEHRRVEGKLFFLSYTCNAIAFSNIKEWTINPGKKKKKKIDASNTYIAK